MILICLVVLSYQPAWNAGFIWDDDIYVTGNELLTAPDGLKRIWFSRDSPSQYFPLTYTSFRVERGFWELNPGGYHRVNIFLHAANVLLLWLLLRKLGISGAWLGAALFAVHPVQVESVAWITERKNLLMLLFSLLTLLAWVAFVKEDKARHGRWRFYLLALMFYVLALVSKTTACTVPAALVLVLWWKRIAITPARLAQVMPFLLLGVGMGLLTMWWERNVIGTQPGMFSLNLLERVLIASRAIWFYLGKLIWPFDLSFSYERWDIDGSDPTAYIGLVALIGAVTAFYFRRRWMGRGIPAALLFYVATLSPMLGIIMLYTFRYTFVADHYQYFASTALLALAGAGLARAVKALSGWRKFTGVAICGSLLLVLGTLTFRHSASFEDEETLWRATIATNPDSLLARNNLGNLLLNRGEIEEAMLHLERTVELDPKSPEPQNNIGLALLGLGQVDEAIARFRLALALAPRSPETHYNLGNALLLKRNVDEAIEHYQEALASRPDFPAAHNDLGHCLMLQKRTAEAMAHFREALRHPATAAPAACNLASALAESGDRAGAMEYYRRAIESNPNLFEAHNNLGLCLMEEGRMTEAVQHFEKAMAIQPGDPLLHANLGNALARLGRREEAIDRYRRAIELDRDQADVHFRLANLLFLTRRLEEAISHYERTVELQPRHFDAHNNLGALLCQTGRAMAGLKHIETALSIKPDHLMAWKNLAWVLATSPDNSVRNGGRAMEAAQEANRLSGGGSPAILGSLAAACAEAGRFAEARQVAQQALQLANAQSNSNLIHTLQTQLKFYEADQAFRDASSLR